ncbi:hypothetical protein COLO4_06587 [Corchorus olitorius]|uniref:Uncharacterized protein n=1 Tax=Corchorus olitorius TaxID=93759 RepID=A0A1R3KMK6_9ROSI|nr:hypothetical protein COLO4_06587 [Corchorus olitorius]
MEPSIQALYKIRSSGRWPMGMCKSCRLLCILGWLLNKR